MLADEHSRRQFIKNGLLSLIALPIARRAQISRSQQVIVQLEGRANDLREEIVSFGLPLPFGFLNDPREVRVLAEDGTELVAAVRSLEPWRTGGREGSIRSVLIQFKADFSARKTQRVTVRFGRRARRTEATVVAVAKTLIDQSADGSAYQIAEAYAWRGDADKAFDWLERAYAQRDGGLSQVQYDPLLREVRADPRYAALVKKLGYP